MRKSETERMPSSTERGDRRFVAAPGSVWQRLAVPLFDAFIPAVPGAENQQHMTALSQQLRFCQQVGWTN